MGAPLGLVELAVDVIGVPAGEVASCGAPTNMAVGLAALATRCAERSAHKRRTGIRVDFIVRPPAFSEIEFDA
jgi:hypothetical protein